MEQGREQGRQVEQARVAVLPEFLTLEELTALRRYCCGRESDFRRSQVVGHEHAIETDYRRSRVLLDVGPFHGIVSERIKTYLPWVLRALRHPHFDIARIESQITASNDGDFFRMHNDNTHADAPTREITYVYFCHREPRAFRGGELLLYNFEREGDEIVAAGVGKRIVPEQNTVVLFKSSCLHEVLPVECESTLFADSRFTLNGWVHR